MAEDLKHLLIETNQEFRELASKHHSLDDRLHELEAKHYLSDAEQFEEVSLKKRKLQASKTAWNRSCGSTVRPLRRPACPRKIRVGHPVTGCPTHFTSPKS